MDDNGAGMPRWVKISIAVTAVVVVLLVVVLLVGQGHGPRRHMPLGGQPGAAAPSADLGS